MFRAAKTGIIAVALTASVLTLTAGSAEAATDFRNCDHMHRTFQNGVARSHAAARRQVRTGHLRPAVRPGSTGSTTRATPRTTAPPARSPADATRVAQGAQTGQEVPAQPEQIQRFTLAPPRVGHDQLQIRRVNPGGLA